MSDAISANRSMLNPQDAAVMSGPQGGMRPGMTIEEFLGQLGLSPQDPIEKLVEVQKMQLKNASPMGKMDSMAGGPGMGTAPAPSAPPPGSWMDRLTQMG